MTPSLTEIAYLIAALLGAGASLRLGWVMFRGIEKAESVMSRLIVLLTVSLLLMVLFNLIGIYFPFVVIAANLFSALFLGLSVGFGLLTLLKIATLKEFVTQAAKSTSKSQ